MYTQQIAEDLRRAVDKAIQWLDENCPPQILGEKSPHIGWWRRYAPQLFLSKDACEGADKFCDLPGVQEFFNEIDNLFFNADRGMCRIFRDVRPEGERICGSSFLMAVVNSGGTGPHVDGEDWPDGCCCVAPFGTGWTGGELVFRALGLGFQLHPGDVIFFRSAELVHENLAVKGNRRSIVMTTDRNSFTGTGQPLDPSKLALIEATLLSINARYNKLSTTERERLLVEQLVRRQKAKQEHDEQLKREAQMSTNDVLRSRLAARATQVAATDAAILVESPHVTAYARHRLNNGLAPIRHKPSKWELQSMPTRAPKQTLLKLETIKGANAQARKAKQIVKTKK